MTKKQEREIKVWEYFMPKHCDWAERTDKDIKMFFEWSQEGKHKDVARIHTYKPEGRTYFHALIWGKIWAGRQIHEMWEPSYLSGDGDWMGYYWLVGGYANEELMPREIVDFIKKEMFKGIDAEQIESSYLKALEEKDEVNLEFKQLYERAGRTN